MIWTQNTTPLETNISSKNKARKSTEPEFGTHVLLGFGGKEKSTL